MGLSPVLAAVRRTVSLSSFSSISPSRGRDSPGIIESGPLVGKELAVVSDLDSRAFLGVLPLYVHVEGYGTHDAVPELLVDQSLYRRAVDLRNLVYPVDRGVRWHVGIERAPHRDLLQGFGDLGVQIQ